MVRIYTMIMTMTKSRVQFDNLYGKMTVVKEQRKTFYTHFILYVAT
jgi:hypothetical protein